MARGHESFGSTATYDPFSFDDVLAASQASANMDPFGMSAGGDFAASMSQTTPNRPGVDIDPFAAPDIFAVPASNKGAYADSHGGVGFNMAPQMPGQTDPFVPIPAAEQMTNYEQGERRSRGFFSKMGEVASRLMGQFKGRDIAGTFGQGGSVDRAIGTAHTFTQRAKKIADSKTVKFAEKIPIAGRYIGAAKQVVRTASSLTEMAHGSYGNMASAVQEVAGDPNGLRDGVVQYGQESGKRAVGAGAKEAMHVVAERTGVKYDREQGVQVKKRKLAIFALKAAMTGGGSLVEVGAEVMHAGVNGARGAARGEVAQARAAAYGAVQSAAETGSFGFTPQSPAEQAPAWNVPDTVPDWLTQSTPVHAGAGSGTYRSPF